jgi:hypothetical protein
LSNEKPISRPESLEKHLFPNNSSRQVFFAAPKSFRVILLNILSKETKLLSLMNDQNLLENQPIAWTPTEDVIERAQLTKFMRQIGVSDFDELYQIFD